MVRLLKRPEAENDLDDIWWYIAQDKPQEADRLLDCIQETLLTLTKFPHMGISRAELKPGLHSFSAYIRQVVLVRRYFYRNSGYEKWTQQRPYRT